MVQLTHATFLYAGVKVYEQMYLWQFHSTISSMSRLQVNCFALISPLSILCLLPGITKTTSVGLEFSTEALYMFTKLEQGVAGFMHADKLSHKRKEAN